MSTTLIFLYPKVMSSGLYQLSHKWSHSLLGVWTTWGDRVFSRRQQRNASIHEKIFIFDESFWNIPSIFSKWIFNTQMFSNDFIIFTLKHWIGPYLSLLEHTLPPPLTFPNVLNLWVHTHLNVMSTYTRLGLCVVYTNSSIFMKRLQWKQTP